MDEPSGEHSVMADPSVRRDYITGIVGKLNNPGARVGEVALDSRIIDQFIAEDSTNPQNWELFDQLVRGVGPENGGKFFDDAELMVKGVRALLAKSDVGDAAQRISRAAAVAERAGTSISEAIEINRGIPPAQRVNYDYARGRSLLEELENFPLENSQLRIATISDLVARLNVRRPDGRFQRTPYDIRLVEKFASEDSVNPQHWQLLDRLAEGLNPERGWAFFDDTQVLVQSAEALLGEAGNRVNPDERKNRVSSLLSRAEKTINPGAIEALCKEQNRVYRADQLGDFDYKINNLANAADAMFGRGTPGSPQGQPTP